MSKSTSTSKLSIETNRSARKYSKGELFLRVLWIFGRWIFRLSPRPCFGFRRFLLRLFGARVGKQVHIYPSAIIYYPWKLEIGDWSAISEWALIYNLGTVRIGERTTISHKAHLCAGTHDHTDPAMPLLRPPITIGDQVWICAEAFIGPQTTIGNGAVVAAAAVVTKDVDPWTVVGGNPARKIKERVIEK